MAEKRRTPSMYVENFQKKGCLSSDVLRCLYYYTVLPFHIATCKQCSFEVEGKIYQCLFITLYKQLNIHIPIH